MMSFTDLFFDCDDGESYFEENEHSSTHRIKYVPSDKSSESDMTKSEEQLTCDTSSDSDSEDDVCIKKPIKKYLAHSLQDSISMAIGMRNRKLGIPRHAGHFKLVDSCHSKSDDSPKFYQGNNYEVEVPALHRTTEQLTREAVQHAVLTEQVARIKEEETKIKRVVNLLQDVRHELLEAIGGGEKHEIEKEEQEYASHEVNKDDMLAELVQTVHARELRLDSDKERKRQEHVLENLVKDELPVSSQAIDDLVFMADINAKKALIHKDISEAFESLEDTKHQIEEEEFLHSQDVKDQAMRELYTAIVRIKIEIEVKTEYKSKLAGVIHLLHDDVHQHTEQNMERVHEELLSNFASVQVDQNETEEILIYKVKERKYNLMEELHKKSLIKELDHACAVERQRRKQQAEIELQHPDLFKDQVRDAMANVLEELIMKKYSKYNKRDDVGLHMASSIDSFEDIHEKMVRAAREKVTDQDDDPLCEMAKEGMAEVLEELIMQKYSR